MAQQEDWARALSSIMALSALVSHGIGLAWNIDALERLVRQRRAADCLQAWYGHRRD